MKSRQSSSPRIKEVEKPVRAQLWANPRLGGWVWIGLKKELGSKYQGLQYKPVIPGQKETLFSMQEGLTFPKNKNHKKKTTTTKHTSAEIVFAGDG